MDIEGFRNKLKQYKKAREENPGLKYWEWKNIPKYDEGTGAVMGPITLDEWFRQLRKKPNIVENEDDEKLIQLIRKKIKNFLYLRNRTNEQGTIPFIEEKAITLSNAGKDTGVRLSTNMLDSIAKYADKADIPLQDALGLVGQESTFGKGYFLDQGPITPSILVSDWSYSDDLLSVNRTENPYVGLMRAAQRKYDSGGYDKSGRFVIYNPDYIKALRGGLPFADKEAKRLRTDIPVLEHAFKKFKSGKYNPGDPNHTQMVKDRGEALMQSPEIQKWIKENNIKYAEGGEVTGPQYEEGTGNVGEWDPRITAEGYDDKGYYTRAMNPLPEITVVGSKTRSRSERPIQYSYVNGYPEATTVVTDYNPGAGALEIVSPEFEILSGGIGIPRQLYENRMANLAKDLVSKSSEKTISKGVTKIKPYFQSHRSIGETFNVPLGLTKELNDMYRRNISKETSDVLSVLGKTRTPSKFQRNLSFTEREFLRKHNVDETILSDKDIQQLKQLRLQSIIDALEPNQRIIIPNPKSEYSQLLLFKNTENGPTPIGYVEYGHDPYAYMSYLGRELNLVSDIDLSDHVTIDMIENISNGLEKGVSKDLYNGLAHILRQRNPEKGGFVTGMKLLSPEPTTKTLNKLDKTLISNQGEYHWVTGTTLDNPIYSIIKPTGNYPPVKSSLFDPKAIKNGKIITDLDNPDIYFAEGGKVEPDPLNYLKYEFNTFI